MNELYYKFIGRNLINFPQIKMSNLVTNKIKDSVVKVLGLRDLGQLRDRFEGQAYLNQQIFKLHSFNASLNYLGLPLPNISKEFIENFKPIIKRKNDMLIVVPFKFESLPKIKIIDFKQPRIFVLCSSERIYNIIGIASVEILNDKSNYINIDPKSKIGEFIGFDKTSLIT
tara:strand:- start:153 stop:665 length:513 start_codon:yes stop_codon:yes gene_type:complete